MGNIHLWYSVAEELSNNFLEHGRFSRNPIGRLTWQARSTVV